jgi:hypothetical protein
MRLAILMSGIALLCASGACGHDKPASAAPAGNTAPGQNLTVEGGARATAAIDLDQCAKDGDAVQAVISDPADSSQSAVLPASLGVPEAGCSKTLLVDISGVPAGSYNLDATVSAEKYHRALTVTEPKPSDPANPSDPKPTGDLFADEPLMDVDCNGKGQTCDAAVHAIVARKSLDFYEGVAARLPVGHADFSGLLNGTFTLSMVGRTPAFTSGDYVIHNGHLAMRAADARRNVYGHWYPMLGNGSNSSAYLILDLPLADGSSLHLTLR